MPALLTKSSIAEHLESAVGLDFTHSLMMVEHFFETMSQLLEEGNSIKLPGLGELQIRSKKSRPGRNPKTGQEILISARRSISFLTSATLKKQLSSKSLDGA